MSDTLYFKHKVTGIIAAHPAHYKDHPTLGKYLVEVDRSEAECQDCGFPEPVQVEPAQEKPVVAILDEPAPIPAVRRAKKD